MDNYSRAIMTMFDEISKVPKNPHASIIRRLRTMRNSLSLEEPMPLHDIRTLDQAIQALEAHS